MASKFGGIPVESKFGGVPVEAFQTQEAEEEQTSAVDVIRGAGETALTLATGAVAQIAAGVGGIDEAVASFVRGDEDVLDQSVDRIATISEDLTFQPRSKEGREFLRTIGVPFQKIDEFATHLGELATKDSGSPEIGAALKTAIVSAPDLLGLKGVRLRAAKRARQAVVEGQAKDIGLDLRQSPDVQRGQLVEQAQRETGGRVSRGTNIEDIQNSIIEAKEIAKQNVDNLYAEAKGTTASIPVSEAAKFRAIAQQSLEGFDIQSMPIVKRRLDELAQIENLPEGRIKLNEIENFRKRLNRNKPASTDTAQNAAVGILKGQLDKFLDAQFNADMIKGSPEALGKWKKAREAASGYQKRFKENKVIKQLGEQQAKPEEVRAWIFGTNKMGFKKESGATINRIKEIVGDDSPQFNALRQDALLNVLDPLLKETPNFKQFSRVYDDLVKNNPTLVKELFPDSTTSLKELRSFAASVEKFDAPPFSMKIEETISRALVGHQIAKATIRVTLLGNILKLMRRAGGKSQRARVLGDILGYDPDVPLIPPAPAIIGGAQETVKQEAENVNDPQLR